MEACCTEIPEPLEMDWILSWLANRLYGACIRGARAPASLKPL